MTPKVPKLRKLPLETTIIERYRRREASVEVAEFRKAAGGARRLAIFDYGEGFYSPSRLHPRLDYRSPDEYVKMKSSA